MPVLFAILLYAERINPESSQAKLLGNLDRVEENWREIAFVYSLGVLSLSCPCQGARMRPTPTMTKARVLSMFSVGNN